MSIEIIQGDANIWGAGHMAKYHRLSAARKEHLIELYRSGLSLRETGEALGVSFFTVMYHLDKAGIPHRTRDELTRTQRAVRLYKSGLTVVEVGDRLGISGPTVLKLLKGAGCPRRKPGTSKLTQAQCAKLRALRAAGATLEDLSRLFGVTKQAISLRLLRDKP